MALPSHALPIGPGAFSGAEALVDFEAVGPGEAITTQYAALGVTFSRGLFGDAFPTTTTLGSMEATNFDATGLLTVSNPIAVSFVAPQLRAGAWVGGGITASDDIRLEAFRAGVSVEAAVFSTGAPQPGGNVLSTFAGLEVGGAGFDRLEFSALTGTGGFSLDDLRFEATPAAPAVPEPSAALLFALGSLLVGARVSRSR